MESKIVEFIWYRLKFSKKNIELIILFGNYYAEDLLVKIYRELEKRKYCKIG